MLAILFGQYDTNLTYIITYSTQSLNSHETRHLIHSLFIFRVKSQHHSNKRYPNICPCSICLICTIRKMLFECLFLIGYSISKESPCCQSIEDCWEGIAEYHLCTNCPVIEADVGWMTQYFVSVCFREEERNIFPMMRIWYVERWGVGELNKHTTNITYIPCVIKTWLSFLSRWI